MPDDRWPMWAAEQAGTNKLPSVGLVFIVFAIGTLLLLNALGGYRAYADHVERGNASKPPTLCLEHQGRPGWDAVCPPPVKPVHAKR
jgi:hypothetical protein